MARPALSAVRGIDVIELLATFPEREFTLSEIARATGINVASCHAVLGALEDRGYLARDPARKTFTLGPVLPGIGEAALRAQPLVARSREAAQALAADLDVPVLLSAAVGEEIVGIVSVPDSAGRAAGLRTGERRPFLPPLGAPFVAWAGEDEIAAWLARGPHAGEQEVEESLRAAVAQIRQRGFQVTLRSPGSPRLAAELDDMARGQPFGDQAQGWRERMRGLVGALGGLSGIPEIHADETYDVILIAAPVFDRAGACRFNLCLTGYTAPLDGKTLLAHADRLLAACLQVMQADRG